MLEVDIFMRETEKIDNPRWFRTLLACMGGHNMPDDLCGDTVLRIFLVVASRFE